MDHKNMFLNEIMVNCASSEQVQSYFHNPIWENSLNQNNPFESSLSSIVSPPLKADNFVYRELIDKLGNFCNSSDVSPNCYSNSTDTSLQRFNLSGENHLPNKVTGFENFHVQQLKDSEFGDSRENSSVSEQIPSGEIGVKCQNDANPKKRKQVPVMKAKETNSKVSSEDNASSSVKRSKSDEKNGSDKDSGVKKDEQKPIEPPKDYIHVRARRGEATDAHSLAERVRREKIRERIKLLQDLVPGCNKITGKALMLDEIINYVQSLQRQVEFLSMKLATLNPRMDFNMETPQSKDMFQSVGPFHHNIIPSQPLAGPFPHEFQSHQGPDLHEMLRKETEFPFAMNALNRDTAQNVTVQLPLMDSFVQQTPQAQAFFEDDLNSVIQMGFGQIQAETLPGNVPITQMKVEL